MISLKIFLEDIKAVGTMKSQERDEESMSEEKAGISEREVAGLSQEDEGDDSE